MSTVLAISRLAKFLSERYGRHLDLTDTAAQQAGDDARLTRCLAAHCIGRFGRLDPDDAAATVTDGYDDLGIDALHYDRPAKMLYLIQAKWSSNGSKTISEGDATKTLKGLRSLLSVDLDSANSRLQAFKQDCDDAANDNETRYTVIFAATASNALSQEANRYVTKEVEQIAGVPGLVLVEEFNRKRLYDTLTDASEPSKISLAVELENWAEVDSPLLSFSGRVSLATVLEWKKHRYALFHKNVRGFLADRELSASLTATLSNSPEYFWYFNNGATLLCDDVKKRPLHGGNRARGIFDLKGVSVVNGAQTIGIIWRFAGDGSVLDPDARLPLRLISLENAPQDFATHVTRALNTQRRIDARDFVALDPLQRRLKRDMALEGRIYVYRSGDSISGDQSNVCSFGDAAVALACAWGDVDLVSRAKREVSQLWASTTDPPYTDLFPQSIDAETVWRACRILKAVAATIQEKREKATGRNKTVLSHGNRFILYKVFKSPAIRGFREPSQSIADLQRAAVAVADRVSDKVCEVLSGAWERETVQYVFKYTHKCRDLDLLTNDGHANTTASDKLSQKPLAGFEQ